MLNLVGSVFINQAPHATVSIKGIFFEVTILVGRIPEMKIVQSRYNYVLGLLLLLLIIMFVPCPRPCRNRRQ